MSRRRKRTSPTLPGTTISDGRFQSVVGAFITQVEGDVSAAFDDIEDLEKEIEDLSQLGHDCGPSKVFPPQIEKLSSRIDVIEKAVKEQEVQQKLLVQKQDFIGKVMWGVGSAAALGVLKILMDFILKAIK